MKKRPRKIKQYQMSPQEYNAVALPWLIEAYNKIIDKTSELSVSQRKQVTDAVQKLIKLGELFELWNKKVERKEKKIEIIKP